MKWIRSITRRCRSFLVARRACLSRAATAAVYFLSHVVFASAYETNLWADRRASTVDNASLLVASLPTAVPVAPFELTSFSGSQTLPISRIKEPALSHLFKALPISLRFRSFLKANPSASRTVILIEDVHRHLEAQKNIGHGIESLIGQSHVDLVALEGAFGPLNLKQFQRYPRQKSVQRVADYLLATHRISGAVRVAFTPSPSIPPFVGVDDRRFYDANVRAVQRSLAAAPERRRQWHQAVNETDRLKERLFNRELREMDRQVESFRRGEKTVADYAALLARDNAGESLSPSVRSLLDVALLEKQLNLSAVSRERDQLMSHLSERLTSTDHRTLTEAATALRSGHRSPWDFYRLLNSISKQKGVVMEQFPHFERYVRYTLQSEGINAERVLLDLQEMEKSALARRVRSPSEKELVALSNRLFLVGKLVDFSLTSAEWKAYQDGALLGSQTSIVESVGNLDSFEAFYRLAERRDRSMAEQLVKEMDRVKASTATLIVGGFHSKGIARLLADKGINTVVVSPVVTAVPTQTGSEALSLFVREKTPLDQVFSGQPLFLTQEVAPPSFRPAAVSVVLDQISEGNIDSSAAAEIELALLSEAVRVRSVNGVGTFHPSLVTPDEVWTQASVPQTMSISAVAIAPRPWAKASHRAHQFLMGIAASLVGGLVFVYDALPSRAQTTDTKGESVESLPHLVYPDDFQKAIDKVYGLRGEKNASYALMRHIAAALKTYPHEDHGNSLAEQLSRLYETFNDYEEATKVAGTIKKLEFRQETLDEIAQHRADFMEAVQKMDQLLAESVELERKAMQFDASDRLIRVRDVLSQLISRRYVRDPEFIHHYLLSVAEGQLSLGGHQLEETVRRMTSAPNGSPLEYAISQKDRRVKLMKAVIAKAEAQFKKSGDGLDQGEKAIKDFYVAEAARWFGIARQLALDPEDKETLSTAVGRSADVLTGTGQISAARDLKKMFAVEKPGAAGKGGEIEAGVPTDLPDDVVKTLDRVGAAGVTRQESMAILRDVVARLDNLANRSFKATEFRIRVMQLCLAHEMFHEARQVLEPVAEGEKKAYVADLNRREKAHTNIVIYLSGAIGHAEALVKAGRHNSDNLNNVVADLAAAVADGRILNIELAYGYLLRIFQCQMQGGHARAASETLRQMSVINRSHNPFQPEEPVSKERIFNETRSLVEASVARIEETQADEMSHDDQIDNARELVDKLSLFVTTPQHREVITSALLRIAETRRKKGQLFWALNTLRAAGGTEQVVRQFDLVLEEATGVADRLLVNATEDFRAGQIKLADIKLEEVLHLVNASWKGSSDNHSPVLLERAKAAIRCAIDAGQFQIARRLPTLVYGHRELYDMVESAYAPVAALRDSLPENLRSLEKAQLQETGVDPRVKQFIDDVERFGLLDGEEGPEVAVMSFRRLPSSALTPEAVGLISKSMKRIREKHPDPTHEREAYQEGFVWVEQAKIRAEAAQRAKEFKERLSRFEQYMRDAQTDTEPSTALLQALSIGRKLGSTDAGAADRAGRLVEGLLARGHLNDADSAVVLAPERERGPLREKIVAAAQEESGISAASKAESESGYVDSELAAVRHLFASESKDDAVAQLDKLERYVDLSDSLDTKTRAFLKLSDLNIERSRFTEALRVAEKIPASSVRAHQIEKVNRYLNPIKQEGRRTLAKGAAVFGLLGLIAVSWRIMKKWIANPGPLRITVKDLNKNDAKALKTLKKLRLFLKNPERGLIVINRLETRYESVTPLFLRRLLDWLSFDTPRTVDIALAGPILTILADISSRDILSGASYADQRGVEFGIKRLNERLSGIPDSARILTELRRSVSGEDLRPSDRPVDLEKSFDLDSPSQPDNDLGTPLGAWGAWKLLTYVGVPHRWIPGIAATGEGMLWGLSGWASDGSGRVLVALVVFNLFMHALTGVLVVDAKGRVHSISIFSRHRENIPMAYFVFMNVVANLVAVSSVTPFYHDMAGQSVWAHIAVAVIPHVIANVAFARGLLRSMFESTRPLNERDPNPEQTERPKTNLDETSEPVFSRRDWLKSMMGGAATAISLAIAEELTMKHGSLFWFGSFDSPTQQAEFEARLQSAIQTAEEVIVFFANPPAFPDRYYEADALLQLTRDVMYLGDWADEDVRAVAERTAELHYQETMVMVEQEVLRLEDIPHRAAIGVFAEKPVAKAYWLVQRARFFHDQAEAALYDGNNEPQFFSLMEEYYDLSRQLNDLRREHYSSFLNDISAERPYATVLAQFDEGLATINQSVGALPTHRMDQDALDPTENAIAFRFQLGQSENLERTALIDGPVQWLLDITPDNVTGAHARIVTFFDAMPMRDLRDLTGYLQKGADQRALFPNSHRRTLTLDTLQWLTTHGYMDRVKDDLRVPWQVELETPVFDVPRALPPPQQRPEVDQPAPGPVVAHAWGKRLRSFALSRVAMMFYAFALSMIPSVVKGAPIARPNRPDAAALHAASTRLEEPVVLSSSLFPDIEEKSLSLGVQEWRLSPSTTSRPRIQIIEIVEAQEISGAMELRKANYQGLTIFVARSNDVHDALQHRLRNDATSAVFLVSGNANVADVLDGALSRAAWSSLENAFDKGVVETHLFLRTSGWIPGVTLRSAPFRVFAADFLNRTFKEINADLNLQRALAIVAERIRFLNQSA